MAKLKKNFLEKVVKENYVETKKYHYRTTNVTEPKHQYYIIKRIPKETIETTSILNDKNWEVVAKSFDGKHFIRI